MTLVTTRSLLPLPSSERAKVAAAARLLREQLDALDARQAAEDRRASVARRVNADVEEIATRIAAKARARAALRQNSFAIDKKWFENFVSEVAADLREQAGEARRAGKSRRADYLDDRLERLGKDVAKIEECDVAGGQ
jgi:hypothetical protein